FSNVSDSGPVHRGVAVMRRVLCYQIQDPSELKIQVVPPPPDPSLTTRERFSQHSLNPSCKACHGKIDPAGFAFEGFDAQGASRKTDNGKDVVTSATLEVGDVKGTFASNLELTAALAASTDVQRCFARNLHRF